MAGSNFIDARKAVDLLTEAFNQHKAILDRTADSLTTLNQKYAELPSDYVRTQKELIKLKQDEERAQQQLIKTQQELQKLKQQELRTDQSSQQVKQQQQRTLAAESRTRQTLIREQQQQARITEQERKRLEKLNSAYLQLRDSLNKAEKEYRDLAAAQGLNNKQTIAAQRNVQRLRKEVDAINTPIGRMNENVGNYPKGFQAASRAIGGFIAASFGIHTVIRVFSDAARIITNFDQAQANLASVLGTTKDGVSDLTDEAIRLGAATKYTATQVSEFQTELARLGFRTDEIKGMTAASLDLATALDSDLGATAELVGSSLRGMNEGFSESTRYTDVLARATSLSALNFERLSVSLPYVTAVAEQNNFSFERLVATMGILVDRGLQAETVGAGLRTSLLRLNKVGLTLEEGLDQIRNSADKTQTALELFGVRGSAIGLILADTEEAVNSAEQALLSAGGTAENMANTQLNTLNGRLTILNSSWEKLILTIENGDGALSKYIRGNIDRLSRRIDDISFLIDNNASLWDNWKVAVNLSTTAMRDMIPWVSSGSGLFEESSRQIMADSDARNRSIASINDQTRAFVKLHGALAPFEKGGPEEKEFNFPFMPGSDAPAEDLVAAANNIRTLQSVLDDLKDAKDRLNNSTKDEAGAILLEISILEKEKAAWEQSKKARKEASDIMKGSITYYEQMISALEAERKKLATNSIEYNSYKDRINEASMALNNLRVQLEGVNELDIDLDQAKAMKEFFETIEEAQKPNQLGLEGPDASGINEALKADIDATRKAEAQKSAIVEAENQRRVDIVFGSLEQFGESYGVDLGAFRTLFDEKKNTLTDYAAAAQEVLSFALNQRLVGYDLELQKAAETRDAILNNERASEEQRRAAELQYQREEARIKNQQAKKERENALIQIAVNTAIGVTQALATVPPPASFVLAGIITAFGALQAGLVASQPLPKFEHGTDNAPQGWAIVDEAGPEIHADKSGRIKSTGSSRGANLRYLEKGDKIFPHGMVPGDQETSSLQNMLWNAGINLYGNTADEKDDRMLNELQGLRKDNKSLKRTVSQLANRPINVTIEDKSKSYYG